MEDKTDVETDALLSSILNSLDILEVVARQVDPSTLGALDEAVAPRDETMHCAATRRYWRVARSRRATVRPAYFTSTMTTARAAASRSMCRRPISPIARCHWS